MLPRIRITDLLSEVARWTLFTDCFTHLRTGETAADSQVLMASLLADGLNLGLTRMAEACSIASLRQLAWTADWHIRDETYALALRRLVDQQQREPLAAMFGSGFASSSDGQFFRAGGFGRDASSINAHYGDEPGVKFYTHLSDRYAPFHTKVIAATASEAAHVLDGLLYHQSEVVARRHHTDGGGDSDHVFALCSLLGFQFAPRIPDLKSRRLYSFGTASAYPSLEPLIAGRINVALIRAHWSEILRVAASIRTGTVTASLILRQLASYPRQNGLATAPARVGASRTHAVHPRLAGRSRTAASARPGAQQRRIAQQPCAGRLHPSPGRDPRPHLREPATPRFRAEPSRHRNHPVEHAIP
jgi:TnpA family transposase